MSAPPALASPAPPPRPGGRTPPPRLGIGTSGWIYPHWRGTFYPNDLPARAWLRHLASRFASVEVNGTFYSMKRPPVFRRWREEVPPTFSFALKGSRYITHMLKLPDAPAPLANFFAQGILLLGRQLGPILWQLPDRLPFQRERAERIFARLPHTIRAAERLAAQHDHRVADRCILRAPTDAPRQSATPGNRGTPPGLSRNLWISCAAIGSPRTRRVGSPSRPHAPRTSCTSARITSSLQQPIHPRRTRSLGRLAPAPSRLWRRRLRLL